MLGKLSIAGAVAAALMIPPALSAQVGALYLFSRSCGGR
jgi:hypothetical protein